MDIPRSGKPKLRITTYTKSEQMQWEKSVDSFQKEQLDYIKTTLTGKPGKYGSKGGKGKEKYWVGLVPYRPDYTNCRRIADSLDVKSNVKVDVLPDDDVLRAGP